MKRKIVTLLGVAALSCAIMTGCGSKDAQTEAPAQETEETAEADTTKADAAEETKEADTEEAEATTEEAEETAAPLEDGVYTAEFDTDSGMFHVNEANDGKGVLTVENGKMTIHVSLASKKIVNLYPGLAEDAQKDGAELLEPTTDTVTYSDGESEEVYGFDVPVKALDQEFDLAILGTKGTWYDHKVSVSNPEPKEDDAKSAVDLEDGTYTAEVTLEGGSGRASIESPATLTVKDGKVTASIVWSSPNYDYMIVDGKKLFPVNTEGNSVFEIPVASFDTELDVIADTVAMSKPHEIEYTLAFDSSTIKTAE